MDVQLLFAGIAVRDFGAAVSWYEKLFGRAADVVVHDEEVMWRVVDTGWLYVVREPDRAGGATVSLSVADLDALVAEVTERGLTGEPVAFVGDAGRRAVFVDPDGNRMIFLEISTA